MENHYCSSARFPGCVSVAYMAFHLLVFPFFLAFLPVFFTLRFALLLPSSRTGASASSDCCS